MAFRRKKGKKGTTGLMVMALLMAIILTFKTRLLVDAAWCILLLAVIYIGARLMQYWTRRKRIRALRLHDVDNLPGHDFEHYVANLLRHQGYHTTVTRGSGDMGVDIVAVRSGIRYAIQCKRYSQNLSRTAVSDAVAGKDHYQCVNAMVVTNRQFTPGAIALAKSTGCILIGRSELADWIMRFQSGRRSAA